MKVLLWNESNFKKGPVCGPDGGLQAGYAARR